MKRVLLGHVLVDSGQVLIADPAYACEASGDDVSLGVVASTVQGDGSYPVYAEIPEDSPDQVAPPGSSTSSRSGRRTSRPIPHSRRRESRRAWAR